MLRLILNTLLICLLLAVLAVASTVWYLLPRLPSIETLKDVRLQVPLRVYTQDNSLIAEFGDKHRTPIKLSEAPELLVKAVLAAEDDRFYEHPGVDWQAILRAALNLIRTGEKKQGGSTITMQVARNFFLSREKTYLRKLNEILLALKIERELNKDEILELYLNKIYFGHRAYGVTAAAQVYYGTELKQLGLPELAMIAALPKAPSKMNPITNPSRAVERRNYILGRMLQLGYITDEEYHKAITAPNIARLHGPAIEVEAPYVAEIVRSYMVEHYGDNVYESGYRVITTIRDLLQRAANQALRKALLDYDQRHGYRGPVHHYPLPQGGEESQWVELLMGFPELNGLRPALVISVAKKSATVYTLDMGLVTIGWEGLAWASPFIDDNRRGPAPKHAGQILKPGDVIYLQTTAEGGWRLAQIPEVEGALVSLDPNNGAILALVGGFDFSRSKFNRVTQGRRQPGSSFKPFIYSAALESGYTPASLINDAPIVFEVPGLDRPWRPENYTRTYYGPTRLRDALAFSRNLVSIRLLQNIGIHKAIRHISRFGFDPKQMPRNLSLALGTCSITPLELTAGYAVLANGGFEVKPFIIDRIETEDGQIVMQSDPPRACAECAETPEAGLHRASRSNYAKRVLSAQNTWIMQSMMRDVIRKGTGKAALVLKRGDLAGKTGTTNEHRDAWFAGFNTRIVTTTWVGFDQNRSLGTGETGARVALPMWIEFMKTALEGMPESSLPLPPELVTVRIDPDTGLVTDAENPRAVLEVFQADTIPKEETSHLPLSGANPEDPTIHEQLF